MDRETSTSIGGDGAVKAGRTPPFDEPPLTDEAEPRALRCKNHRGTETYLRCGKCGEPICGKCSVITVVGARCRDCAQLRRLPTFNLSPRDYSRALGAMLGAAMFGGALAGLLRPSIPFAGFLIPLGLGYLIGEAVARAANRKRATPLKAIAGVGVVLAYALQPLGFLLGSSGLVGLGSLGQLAAATLLGTLASPFGLLALALGILIAINRF